MAFKYVTVNASKVPSTQSNYPSFFNPSRAGVTTTAELDSGRVYADSGKVVELPIENVSTSESHTLFSSLTSSSGLYYDYDGIRSAYAVTDTYGRNAVWSDYKIVAHLDSALDSTGNQTVSITGATSGATGQIDNGYDFDNGDYLTAGSFSTTNGAYTWSIWFNQQVTIPAGTNMFLVDSLSGRAAMAIRSSTLSGVTTNNSICYFGGAWQNTTVANTVGSLTKITLVSSGSNVTIYKNGSSAWSASYSMPAMGSSFGFYVNIGLVGATTTNGIGDESRVRVGTISADWETTEYNNQSDESTFWGTWTDVPVGTAVRNPLVFGGGL